MSRRHLQQIEVELEAVAWDTIASYAPNCQKIPLDHWSAEDARVYEAVFAVKQGFVRKLRELITSGK